ERAVAVAAHRRAGVCGGGASLERERRFGTFVVELSRWLLAVPDRELLLRYTLQSLMSLGEAQGAYGALKNVDGDALRIAATVGRSIEMEGLVLSLEGN